MTDNLRAALDEDDWDSISLMLAQFPTWFPDLEAKVDAIRIALASPSPEPLDGLRRLATFGHAVAMALTERKVPDDWDADNLTHEQVIEGTVRLLDRLDDATDEYIDASGADLPHVSRAMQADLRALAARLSEDPR